MIRKAEKKDVPSIMALLHEVESVHNNLRPDIFSDGGSKYTEEEVSVLINDAVNPVFVCDEDGVCGYIFCKTETTGESSFMHYRKVLYIDDLCVFESKRGQGIGQKLYSFAESYARENKYTAVTLNVWSGNTAAERFYDKMGLKPLKTVLEKVL